MALRFIVSALLAASPPERDLLALSWSAPAGCPDRDDAIAALREHLPSLSASLLDAFDAERADTGVDVEIVGGPTGEFTARLRFTSIRGTDERSIVGPSCAVVGSAVVLVVAVTIDPVATVEALATPAAAEPEPKPEPEPAPPSRPDSSSRRPDSEPVTISLHLTPAPEPEPKTDAARVAIGVFGGGGLGPIQAGTGTLGLDLSAFAPWWRFSLRGAWVLPRILETDGNPARFDAWMIGGRGCVVPRVARDRVELPVCAGVEAGSIRGRGVDPTPNPRDAREPWVGVELGPGLRYVPHPRVAVGVEADLVIGLVRGGFTIGETVVQEHAPVGFRGLLAVEIRLP